MQGRVAWVFEEDNYDIDLIIGIKNIKLSDLEELASVAMAHYDAGFRAAVQPGGVLGAGHNIGHMGITGVTAESFSPGFYRGEISMGFPLVTCPGIRAAVQRWDTVQVDWDAGTVRNLSRGGAALAVEPLASADRGMLESGGLNGWLKARLRKPQAA